MAENQEHIEETITEAVTPQYFEGLRPKAGFETVLLKGIPFTLAEYEGEKLEKLLQEHPELADYFI